MFEVGFGEILMIGLVALLVLGPEQLPKVARTAGLWLGKARRVVASVRADIERELKAEELRELLNKQALSNPLEELITETQDALRHPVRATTSTVPVSPRDQVAEPAVNSDININATLQQGTVPNSAPVVVDKAVHIADTHSTNSTTS